MGNVTFFFDTRPLLRLLGFEGEYQKAVYRELIGQISMRKGRLAVFDHTIDEVDGILKDCERWVEDPGYDARLASPSLRFFVERNYSASDIVLFRSQLSSTLKTYGITTVDGGYRQGVVRDMIDEQKLYETIVWRYQENADSFEEYQKASVIQRDVKSVSAVARLREGRPAKQIKDAVAIFVTSNVTLAHAVSEFFRQSQIDVDTIPECVTDRFVGTVLWLDSPVQIVNAQHHRLIADSTAALSPSPELLMQWTNELNKMRDRDDLDDEQYYFLRSHEIPLRMLELKTQGDPDQFHDRLPEEIYEAIRRRETAQHDQKISEMQTAHAQEVMRLRQEKERNEKETARQEQTLEAIDCKLTAIARRMVRILGASIGLALFILSFFSYTALSFPQLWQQHSAALVLAIVGFMNIWYGWTGKAWMARLENRIRDMLYNRLGAGALGDPDSLAKH